MVESQPRPANILARQLSDNPTSAESSQCGVGRARRNAVRSLARFARNGPIFRVSSIDRMAGVLIYTARDALLDYWRDDLLSQQNPYPPLIRSYTYSPSCIDTTAETRPESAQGVIHITLGWNT